MSDDLVWCLQVKDLRERLDEAESSGSRRVKAQLQSMEGRIAGLEEQLDSTQRLPSLPD